MKNLIPLDAAFRVADKLYFQRLRATSVPSTCLNCAHKGWFAPYGQQRAIDICKKRPNLSTPAGFEEICLDDKACNDFTPLPPLNEQK